MVCVNVNEKYMSKKAKPQVIGFKSQSFKPRFEYGEMAEVTEVTGTSFGTKLGTGFARFRNAEIPWTVRYDEVILVLEGEFTVRNSEGEHTARAKDCIWLPTGTELTYVASNALVFYAIEPADWSES